MSVGELYSSINMDMLKRIAKENAVVGYSRLKKKDLFDKILKELGPNVFERASDFVNERKVKKKYPELKDERDLALDDYNRREKEKRSYYKDNAKQRMREQIRREMEDEDRRSREYHSDDDEMSEEVYEKLERMLNGKKQKSLPPEVKRKVTTKKEKEEDDAIDRELLKRLKQRKDELKKTKKERKDEKRKDELRRELEERYKPYEKYENFDMQDQYNKDANDYYNRLAYEEKTNGRTFEDRYEDQIKNQYSASEEIVRQQNSDLDNLDEELRRKLQIN